MNADALVRELCCSSKALLALRDTAWNSVRFWHDLDNINPSTGQACCCVKTDLQVLRFCEEALMDWPNKNYERGLI